MTLATIKECVRRGIHVTKEIIQDAVHSDGIHTLRFLWEIKDVFADYLPQNYFKTTDLLSTSAQAGNYECCEFLLDEGMEGDDFCSTEAAIIGNLPILQLFYSRGVDIGESTILEVCAAGQLECFIFCIETVGSEILRHHIRHMLKYPKLIEYCIYRNLIILSLEHIDTAVNQKYWDTLEFLLSHNLYMHLFRPYHTNRFVMHRLDNLIEQVLQKGLSFSTNVCNIAIKNKDIDMLRMLHLYGYPVRLRQCKLSILTRFEPGLFYCVPFLNRKDEISCISFALSRDYDKLCFDLIQRGCPYSLFDISRSLSKKPKEYIAGLSDHPVFRSLFMNLSVRYTEDFKRLHSVIQQKKRHLLTTREVLKGTLGDKMPNDIIQYVISGYL